MAAKKKPLPRSLKLKSLAGGAPACGNPLRFTMQQQQQTQWCWAAVSVSVNLFYHPASGQTQCAVANVAMNQTTCCQNGGTAQCNQPWFLDQALQIVGDLNAWSPGKAAFANVRSEVDNCRPLCLRIGWNGGGGHFVTAYGYSTQPNRRINIADPWYGNSVVPYAPFPSGYQGGGTWTDSYTTRA
jgi:Papain-like cysteine protease AvrRpt2